MARFVKNMRGAVSFVEVGVKSAAGDANDTAPRIASGAGSPPAVLPNGSIYLRTDGANAASSLYMRIGGAWVAMDGS